MADNDAFSYRDSKIDYMALVKQNFDDDSTHSETTISNTIEKLKDSTNSYLHKHYEVSEAFGHEILIEKRKLPGDPIVQVLTFGDVFDVFIKYHIVNNHEGGRKFLIQAERKLRNIYKYPALCLSLLVKSCNVCKAKRPKLVGLNRIGSVFVTVMIEHKKANHYFRYLLIYIDRATDYIIIRPLKQKNEVEVSMEIFKILMQFGPPQKLWLYGYSVEFNIKVRTILRQVCQMDLTIEFKSANLDPSAIIVDKLQEWMNKNKSVAWEIGCSIVQKQLNMDVKQKMRQTEDNKELSSHDLLFGKMPTQPGIIQKTITSYNEGERLKLQVLQPSSSINSGLGTTTEHIPLYRDLETTGIDDVGDEVVELRIPSPENFDLDLLSQFEDSKISQEFEKQPQDKILDDVNMRTVKNQNNPEIILPFKTVAANESEVTTGDHFTRKSRRRIVKKYKNKNMAIEQRVSAILNKKKSTKDIKKSNNAEENTSKQDDYNIKRDQTLLPSDSDGAAGTPNDTFTSTGVIVTRYIDNNINHPLVSLDLRCEDSESDDNDQVEEEKPRKNLYSMSLRSSKKVNVIERKEKDGKDDIMNYKDEEEELIYNPDNYDMLDGEEDPLDI